MSSYLLSINDQMNNRIRHFSSQKTTYNEIGVLIIRHIYTEIKNRCYTHISIEHDIIDMIIK